VDTEAPSVALTSPSNNQTVSGNVSITASANDNVAVGKVEFRLNGSLIASDTSAPFATTWNASSAASGYHTVEAKAFDSSGNPSLIDAAQVLIEEIIIVADTLPPSVTILSPSNGSTLGNRTTITASASDENGVVEMKVYIDGRLKATQSANSVRVRWNTRKISKGAHTIRVEARDAAGNFGYDESVYYK